MAQSYGFFDSKNGDRKYSAEDFNKYLSGLICNGIFDSYGDCFRVTANNDLTVTVGSGKAWIDGHYFVNDAPITYNLASYVQSAAESDFIVGICCNTSEDARNCKLLITQTSAAYYVDSDAEKYLTIARVVVPAGATSITQNNITDYREDESKCGYVKCILGKCKVSEVIEQIDTFNVTVNELNREVLALQNRLSEVEEMTGMTGVTLVSSGHCGDNVSYFLYSNGNLKLTGSGETYDYNANDEGYNPNHSPFYKNSIIKTINITSGITTIGSCLFYDCANLENVELPDTILQINEYAFSTAGTNTGTGLKSINLPNRVRKIGKYAFYGTRLSDITLPSGILSLGLGTNIFDCCVNLKTAWVDSQVTGSLMFTYCSSLESLTISNRCKKLAQGILTLCSSLETLNYEGTVAEWEAIDKSTGWIQNDSGNHYHNGYLQKIQCSDGYLSWTGSSWAKVV